MSGRTVHDSQLAVRGRFWAAGAPLLPAEKRERHAEIGRQVERERGTVDGGEYLDSAKERSARVSRPFREITMHFGTWMIGGFATWEASS